MWGFWQASKIFQPSKWQQHLKSLRPFLPICSSNIEMRKSQAAEEGIPRQFCLDRWLVMLYFGGRAANHILSTPFCITKKYERCLCPMATSVVQDTQPYSSNGVGLCFSWRYGLLGMCAVGGSAACKQWWDLLCNATVCWCFSHPWSKLISLWLHVFRTRQTSLSERRWKSSCRNLTRTKMGELKCQRWEFLGIVYHYMLPVPILKLHIHLYCNGKVDFSFI